jgi:hypothetical protein
MRRVSTNEVRLLEDLLPDIAAGSLLTDEESGALPKVYKLYWEAAQADSFAA